MNDREWRGGDDDEDPRGRGWPQEMLQDDPFAFVNESSHVPAREPAINIPAVVLALILSFVAVHVVREYLLSFISNRLLITYAAFYPARYAMPPDIMPGGWLAWLASPFLHAFLHAGWTHLLINAVWLAAFGTPVARRIGAVRFRALFFISAAAGAFTFLMLSPNENAMLIGASGGISGLMGAAIRLLYARGESLDFSLSRDLNTVRPLTLAEIFRNQGALIFIAIWLGGNLVFGLAASHALDASGEIAWQAHMGGFLTGLFLFGLFDRPRS